LDIYRSFVDDSFRVQLIVSHFKYPSNCHLRLTLRCPDSERTTVCDAAEQLQDKGKVLSYSILLKDEFENMGKRMFNALADRAVSKGSFMKTAPLAFLISRAHAAATATHAETSLSSSLPVQLRARSGGEGVSKRRGSVRETWSLLSLQMIDIFSRLSRKMMHRS
jgi:hypothetical protein